MFGYLHFGCDCRSGPSDFLGRALRDVLALHRQVGQIVGQLEDLQNDGDPTHVTLSGVDFNSEAMLCFASTSPALVSSLIDLTSGMFAAEVRIEVLLFAMM